MNPQAYNKYSYCYNNPYKYVDIDGHFPFLAAVVGAVIGAVVNVTVHAATALITHTEVTWADIGRSALEGAITGGIAVIAGPMAGTIVKSLGFTASKVAVTAGAALINGVSGLGAYSAGEGIKAIETRTYEWNGTEAGKMALSNAGTGVLTSLGLPTKGMSTIKQAEYFAPRTSQGFVNPGKNATAIELGTAIGTTFSGMVNNTNKPSNTIVNNRNTNPSVSQQTTKYNSASRNVTNTQKNNNYSYSYTNVLMQYYYGY
jgi:hypothetical protein